MGEQEKRDFLVKLNAYAERVKGKDLYVPLYRKLRIKPCIFWKPAVTFFVFLVVYQILFSAVFAIVSLVQEFSVERLLILLELTLSSNLMIYTGALALVTAISGILIRKNLNYDWGE